jgi:hypothetical protein
MSSVISICNLALSNIGKSDIQDIDEASAEAKACKQFYEHTRDVLLQSYPWRFATITAALASVTNTKADRWEYAYQRPNDCLKVIRITDVYDLPYSASDGSLIIAGAHAYHIEGDKLFCYLAPAYLTYTRRLVDPSKYPPLFIEALAWHLAVRLAMPLTRDPKIRADAYQLAVQTFGQAGVADANEVREVEDVPSRAIEAR